VYQLYAIFFYSLTLAACCLVLAASFLAPEKICYNSSGMKPAAGHDHVKNNVLNRCV